MEERRKPVLGRVVPGVSPDLQRRLRRFFAFVQALSPSLAGKLALRMFLTPPRRPLDPDDAPIVAQAVRTIVSIGSDSFTMWRWGEGSPVVVVLHGWGSHAARFGNFIAPLRAAGYTVIGIDAPAHGQSPGKTSDLPRFRDSLAAVLRAHQPVHAVIGHSLGGAATLTVLADTKEFHPRKICIFGVPADMDYILESFGMMLSLRSRALESLRARFARQFGHTAREVSLAAAAPHVRIPVLVVHDEDDNVAPIEQASAVTSLITGATLLRTRGLGHSGGLRDAATIEKVVAFLRE
jgi:pimeloyl-ACP methyl ester carboxylesterase